MHRGSALLCLLLGFALVGIEPRLRACENGIEERINPRAEAVAAAEQALRAGNYLAAAGHASRVQANLRAADGADPLTARALRVMALVSVRTGGLWLRQGKLSASGDAERAMNLEWAVSKLRRRVMSALGHPERLSDLGEALTARAEHQEEASNILEYLAQRQLITSAHAYAALAQLRAARGDADGEKVARARCKQLTKTAGVCGDSAGA